MPDFHRRSTILGMQKSTLPQIVLDVDPLLRRWGLPYWTWARMRRMRVGDILVLADFDAPNICGILGNVGVTLTRERGGLFRLEAGWVAHLGKNAQRRGHLLTWVDFKMCNGRQLELHQPKFIGQGDGRLRALELVTVVMRRAVLLARWAKRDGDRAAYTALSPDHCMNGSGQPDGALAWLEKLRGPELRATPPAQ
jgi:hypothetical protein